MVGGLLPPDLVSKLSSGDGFAGLKSGAYHLAGGESPREAANRAWSYLTGVWTAYRAALDQLPETDRATSLTRERWLLVLLRELGFGRVPVTGAGGLAADGKAFPVSHVWEHVPVHLLGWRVDLDHRSPGVGGAADASPQSLVQELLNRSDGHLWGLLSNGRVLRLLRDSTSLVGSAYVEFDLEAIFGELFPEILLLFTLVHQSRFEKLDAGGTAADCWLECWRTEAEQTGTRALNLLRDGVVAAIERLGTGFVRANPSLRAEQGRVACRCRCSIRRCCARCTGCCSCSSPRTGTRCCTRRPVPRRGSGTRGSSPPLACVGWLDGGGAGGTGTCGARCLSWWPGWAARRAGQRSGSRGSARCSSPSPAVRTVTCSAGERWRTRTCWPPCGRCRWCGSGAAGSCGSSTTETWGRPSWAASTSRCWSTSRSTTPRRRCSGWPGWSVTSASRPARTTRRPLWWRRCWTARSTRCWTRRWRWHGDRLHADTQRRRIPPRQRSGDRADIVAAANA